MSADVARDAVRASSDSAAPAPGAAIIVFDGLCHLCSGWVQFLLRRDPQGRYRFASLQSAAGRSLMQGHGLDPDDPVSFLLLDDGVAKTDTDAIVDVLTGLGGPWRMAGALRWMPRVIRDPLYRFAARHRYRLFGRRNTCWLPDAENASRFVD